MPSAATAANVFVGCQANDHGFGGIRVPKQKRNTYIKEIESPVSKRIEPVQPKQKYTRRSKPTKKNDKEFVEPWTIEEEIALCKAFVAKSEDSVEGNGKKAAGFWREVAEHFYEEMGRRQKKL
ncbi:hypothetical protein Tco_1308704 [Tanacetum coccineum]